MDVRDIHVRGGEINGWVYYRNPFHLSMVAYHRSAGEQLIFNNDEAFEKWLKAEEKEREGL
jgi:hypothetical protein